MQIVSGMDHLPRLHVSMVLHDVHKCEEELGIHGVPRLQSLQQWMSDFCGNSDSWKEARFGKETVESKCLLLSRYRT